MGLYIRILGDIDQALTATLKCIEINPNSPEAYINLGNIYAATGNNDQALASAQKALILDPDHPLAHLNIGNIYRY